MKKFTDRKLIREYLLGRLNEQAEVEDSLSESIFFDDEMAEVVDSVEDELIEEYLEGSLTASDRDAVTAYFLQAPERQEKLRFAKLLASHLGSGRKPPVADDKEILRATVPWHSDLRTYGLMAALALVVIGAVTYLNQVRRAQTRLESELAQVKEHPSQLVASNAPAISALAPLTLVADRSRAVENRLPTVELSSSTRRIIVDIPLSSSGGAFEVRLENKSGGTSLWSARLSALISKAGDARLLFDVPGSAVQSDGVYSFVITPESPANHSAKYYDFQAKHIN